MNNKTYPILQVAAKAVIVNGKGQVLIVRESRNHATNTKAGYWGIPGGRLEPGENFFDGLKREIYDEVYITIVPIKPICVGEWNPVINGKHHQIIGIFILCEPLSSEVKISGEHDNFAWIHPSDRKKYPFMTPDDKVVDSLCDL